MNNKPPKHSPSLLKTQIQKNASSFGALENDREVISSLPSSISSSSITIDSANNTERFIMPPFGENEKNDSSFHQDMQKRTGPPGLLFPAVLYKILKESTKFGHEHIISWLPDGRAFKIHDRDEFVEKVLPKYYPASSLSGDHQSKNNNNISTTSTTSSSENSTSPPPDGGSRSCFITTSAAAAAAATTTSTTTMVKQFKWKSFLRQINLYGFERITSKTSNLLLGRNKNNKTIDKSELGAYIHTFFRRDDEALCCLIQRKDGKSKPRFCFPLQSPLRPAPEEVVSSLLVSLSPSSSSSSSEKDKNYYNHNKKDTTTTNKKNIKNKILMTDISDTVSNAISAKSSRDIFVATRETTTNSKMKSIQQQQQQQQEAESFHTAKKEGGAENSSTASSSSATTLKAIKVGEDEDEDDCSLEEWDQLSTSFPLLPSSWPEKSQNKISVAATAVASRRPLEEEVSSSGRNNNSEERESSGSTLSDNFIPFPPNNIRASCDLLHDEHNDSGGFQYWHNKRDKQILYNQHDRDGKSSCSREIVDSSTTTTTSTANPFGFLGISPPSLDVDKSNNIMMPPPCGDGTSTNATSCYAVSPFSSTNTAATYSSYNGNFNGSTAIATTTSTTFPTFLGNTTNQYSSCAATGKSSCFLHTNNNNNVNTTIIVNEKPSSANKHDTTMEELIMENESLLTIFFPGMTLLSSSAIMNGPKQHQQSSLSSQSCCSSSLPSTNLMQILRDSNTIAQNDCQEQKEEMPLFRNQQQGGRQQISRRSDNLDNERIRLLARVLEPNPI